MFAVLIDDFVLPSSVAIILGYGFQTRPVFMGFQLSSLSWQTVKYSGGSRAEYLGVGDAGGSVSSFF